MLIVKVMNFNLFDHSYPIRTSRDSTNEIYQEKHIERKWMQIVQIVVCLYTNRKHVSRLFSP